MSEQFQRNLRIVAWVVLAMVVIALVVWFVLRGTETKKQMTQSATSANPVTVIPSNQLPPAFPPNVPMEAGAAVKSNFNASASNGQFQATRSFQSRKTVAANFAIYDAFLASATNGWTIVSEDNASGSANASLFAKGNGGWITISMSALPPQPYPATLVTITYVTNPVTPSQTSASAP